MEISRMWYLREDKIQWSHYLHRETGQIHSRSCFWRYPRSWCRKERKKETQTTIGTLKAARKVLLVLTQGATSIASIANITNMNFHGKEVGDKPKIISMAEGDAFYEVMYLLQKWSFNGSLPWNVEDFPPRESGISRETRALLWMLGAYEYSM